MDGYFNLNELAQSLVDEFDLYDDESTRKNLYQYLYQHFKKTGVEKFAARAINPETKRECSYYSQAQRDALLNDEAVVKHLCDIAKDADCVRERLAKRIEAIKAYNNSFLDLMEEIADSSPDDQRFEQDVWAENKVSRLKPQMMLEALFEVFFTPFDDEKLKEDLLATCEMDGPNPQYSQLEALERLRNPEGNYFGRRDSSEDSEQAL